MLEHEDLPKLMVVSQYEGGAEEHAVVIHTFKRAPEGSSILFGSRGCLAVNNNFPASISEALKGRAVSPDVLLFWQHYDEIQKSTFMTQEQCILWAFTEGSSGWQVKCSTGSPVSPMTLHYNANIEKYKRRVVTKLGFGEWKQFLIE